MDAQDYKDLKKALWEVEMKKEGKGDIPYLEYQDILEIVKEQRETGGKINLSQEAYSFYQKDFHKVLSYLEEQEQEKQKEKAANFHIQVEKDKQRVIEIMLKQNSTVPFQVRQNEEQIKQTVKMACGNVSAGDLSYRKALARLIGGELQADWNTVKTDKRVLDERMIQDNFNKQQAEKKMKASASTEQNEKPIL